jgi:hypothetical protein
MPKDPFIREKFTKEHVAARKLAKGIFRALPEGSVQDRGRKLAQSAVVKYRVHDEAATGAD